MNTRSLMLGMLLFAFACQPADDHSHGADAHADQEEAGHDAAANKEEVHLMQKQMDVMDIRLGSIRYLNLSTTLKASGQLELPPQNKASLGAIMGGRVSSIKVAPGQYVKKGDILATLEHPDIIQLQEDYLNALSQSDFLEKEYQRKRSLFKDSISSGKAFEKAEADYRSASARLSGLKAKLSILDLNAKTIENGNFVQHLPLRSSINGYVQHINVNMGMFVQPQQEMFEIADNEHIHVDLKVYEQDMGKVKNGQKVIFSLANFPDSIFQGNIFAVGRSFESGPKAMTVHAELNNKTGDLLPGMYVDARIITNEQGVASLPNDALVSDGGLSYIFVLDPNAAHEHENAHGHDHEEGEEHDHGEEDTEFIFRKMEVNTGVSDIGHTEVVPVDELPEDAQIVTKGAFYLLAEMKKGEGGHGHHH